MFCLAFTCYQGVPGNWPLNGKKIYLFISVLRRPKKKSQTCLPCLKHWEVIKCRKLLYSCLEQACLSKLLPRKGRSLPLTRDLKCFLGPGSGCSHQYYRWIPNTAKQAAAGPRHFELSQRSSLCTPANSPHLGSHRPPAHYGPFPPRGLIPITPAPPGQPAQPHLPRRPSEV